MPIQELCKQANLANHQIASENATSYDNVYAYGGGDERSAHT